MREVIYNSIIDTRKIGKYQMLERLQFSENLQVAIKASQLLSGELSEENIFGAFLTAVLKNDYADAIQRADDKNLRAITARDFSVGKFVYIAPDKFGFITGEKYYLKIRTYSGVIEITPTVNSDAQPNVYPNLKEFLFNFKSA